MLYADIWQQHAANFNRSDAKEKMAGIPPHITAADHDRSICQ